MAALGASWAGANAGASVSTAIMAASAPRIGLRVRSVLMAALRGSVDTDLPHHSRLHVIEQMAVKSPRPRRVGRDAERAARAGRHADRVLTHEELAGLVLEVAPHAVQMN